MSTPISHVATRSGGRDHQAPPDSRQEPEEARWGNNPPEEEIETLASLFERDSENLLCNAGWRSARLTAAVELRALHAAHWPPDGSEPHWKRKMTAEDYRREGLACIEVADNLDRIAGKSHAAHVATTIQDGIKAFVEGGAE